MVAVPSAWDVLLDTHVTYSHLQFCSNGTLSVRTVLTPYLRLKCTLPISLTPIVNFFFCSYNISSFRHAKQQTYLLCLLFITFSPNKMETHMGREFPGVDPGQQEMFVY